MAPPEAPGPPWYTVVTTTHDEVVTPYQSQALAGDRATNVILQDKCPEDPFEHVTIVGDPVALDAPGSATGAIRPDAAARGLHRPRLGCAAHRPWRAATAPGRASAAARATVRVRLSRAGVRSLARRHRLSVRARALLPRPGGGVAVTSRRYRLR